MRISPSSTAAAVIASLCLAGAGSAQCPAGDEQVWVGGIATAGFVSIRVTACRGPEGVRGTLDFPYQGPSRQGIPLSATTWTDSTVAFAWSEESGPARVEGRVQGGTMVGVYRQGADTGTVHLAQGIALAPADMAHFHGLYQLAPGHVVWVGPVSELRLRTGYVDAATGRAGILYPTSPNTFVSGTTALLPFPAGASAAFPWADASGAGDIIFQEGHRSARRGVRLDTYRTEEVAFGRDTIRLSGTLVLPNRRGPHPAVVLVHGSGPALRSYFSALPYLLANEGIAVLTYDKRGVGASVGGDRRRASLQDLADDALAGVRALRSRLDIDPRQIGLFGHSQGGWKAPLAAVRGNGAVSFVVMSAGPARTFEEQTNDEVASAIREAGLTESDVAAALAHQRLYWRVVRGEAPFTAVAASTEHARSRPWGRFVWKPASEADMYEERAKDYDPAPVLARLRVPTLALYGARDDRVSVENAELIRRALEGAGNPDFEVVVFQGADHDLWTAPTGTARDMLLTTGYVPGYLPLLLGWIRAHVTVP